jgi:hypothetical protein
MKATIVSVALLALLAMASAQTATEPARRHHHRDPHHHYVWCYCHIDYCWDYEVNGVEATMNTKGATLTSLKDLLPENMTPATELYGGKTAAELYGTKAHDNQYYYTWCYYCYEWSYCWRPGMQGNADNKGAIDGKVDNGHKGSVGGKDGNA